MAITAGRRLLEDGSFRLLEEGGIRLLEDFDLEGFLSILLEVNLRTGATVGLNIAQIDETDVNIRTAGTLTLKTGN